MTDAKIIEHLRRYSSDPDDQSLVYRVDRLAELKTRAGALSPVEERLMRVLEIVNERELYFLRQDYRLSAHALSALLAPLALAARVVPQAGFCKETTEQTTTD